MPVMVDFWATWCGPCRMIAPLVEELASEYDGKVVIGKCNVDENQEVPMKYGIRNIPWLTGWSVPLPRPTSRRSWIHCFNTFNPV